MGKKTAILLVCAGIAIGWAAANAIDPIVGAQAEEQPFVPAKFVAPSDTTVFFIGPDGLTRCTRASGGWYCEVVPTGKVQ